jgi:hypothetical protein
MLEYSQVCKQCGKPLEHHHYLKNIDRGYSTKNRWTDFCSVVCKREHARGVVKGVGITKTCKLCGKVFTTTNRIRKYCGEGCSYLAFKNRIRLSVRKNYFKRKSERLELRKVERSDNPAVGKPKLSLGLWGTALPDEVVLVNELDVFFKEVFDEKE